MRCPNLAAMSRLSVLDPPPQQSYAKQATYSPTKSLLVDVMSTSQKAQLRLLIFAWALGMVVFYTWWFRLSHVTDWLRFSTNTLLITWTLAVPAYFFFFVLRMKRTNPSIQVSSGWRVAMVTTRAPAEPFELVKKTLLGMLAQSYPHDTWLADEDPTDEVYEWCHSHGVLVSCRRGAVQYHRDSWPRRTKCKEGNLAYFYDHYGYEDYDYVVQLDADHVPQPGYLEEMLKPFVDSSVGYVSAPSICSTNSTSSWSARGRLFSEAVMHGPLQAGYSAGFAPLCIGSHYAIRTRALREIGGLGPELAEDHSTTLMMNSHGWRGVHAFDAIATGEGPPSLSACFTQEFQWSRSLMVILLTLLPRYWSRLPWKLRIQFLFSELWYPFFSFSMLLGLLLPVVAVVTDCPWVRVSYLSFVGHALPPLAITIYIQFFLRKHGWLRPANCPFLSWEVGLFQIIRWPWAALGCAMGFLSVVAKKSCRFRVTPKGDSHTRSLPWKLLAPYLSIVVISFLPACGPQAQQAGGYYFFLILAQLAYLVAVLTIVLVHAYEARKAR